jgi:enoyl-[acyl-carrier-protein] reductase (NADH)
MIGPGYAFALKPREAYFWPSLAGTKPSLADVAEAAAFLASDRAAGITGSMANVTCGLVFR